MNVNDTVRITLTKNGADLWNETSYGGSRASPGDVIESQLWVIMERLGRGFILGFEAPFMEIEVLG